MHLFLQLEPSGFLNGHMTSLLTSEREKELVREDRGGMAGLHVPGGGRREVAAEVALIVKW